jgi:hypothetical protein
MPNTGINTYTVVAYVKHNKAVVIVYKKTHTVRIVMRAEDVENAAILRTIETHGVITKRWQEGGATAYTAHVPAAALDAFLP